MFFNRYFVNYIWYLVIMVYVWFQDLWGGWDREEYNKRGLKYLDLKSRGFCLVFIFCILVVYYDNSVIDYWSFLYRGFLYC